MWYVGFVYFGCDDLDLLARLISQKSIQSCFVEPAKSDIPPSNFAKFVYHKYLKQIGEFYDKHDKNLSIPCDWVWTPDNVDEKNANDKYLQMPVILLAIQCLHAMYKSRLNFDVYNRVIQVLCFGMYNENNDADDEEEQDVDVELNNCHGKKVVYTKPVTARLIKYMVYNNGAGNAGKVTVGDYGFTKPYWIDPVSKTKHQYNQYCRVRGVK